MTAPFPLGRRGCTLPRPGRSPVTRVGRSTLDQCAWDSVGRRRHSDYRVGAAGTSREELREGPLDRRAGPVAGTAPEGDEEIREQRQPGALFREQA